MPPPPYISVQPPEQLALKDALGVQYLKTCKQSRGGLAQGLPGGHREARQQSGEKVSFSDDLVKWL